MFQNKCGVKFFAITSLTVNRFRKFFHCWKQQWIIYKINKIFLAISQKPRCTTDWNRKVKNTATALRMLDDKAVPNFYHHHHHHPRISSRRKSRNKTSGPLCVTYYTTAVMSMLLWPIVCIAVWSAEQFRLQCTLECPQRWQRRDRRRQHIPNLCSGDREGAIADGPVQRPWNMQRRWRCRSQTPTCLDVGDPL